MAMRKDGLLGVLRFKDRRHRGGVGSDFNDHRRACSSYVMVRSEAVRAHLSRGFVAIAVALVPMLLVATVLFPVSPASAQEEPISLVRLANSVVPAVSNGQLKPVSTPPSTSTKSLTLTLTLKRSDQAGFEEYLSKVEDHSSPAYRHFLTQTQITEEFGPSQASYDAVSSWLRSQGFTLVQGSADRLSLTVTGSRADAVRAFHTQIAEYRVGARATYANTEEPALPREIASDVEDVSGLSNVGEPQAAPVDQYKNPNEYLCSSSTELGFYRTLFNPSYCAGAVFGYFFYWTPIFLDALEETLFPPPPIRDPPPVGSAQKIGLLEFDTYHASDVTDWLNLLGLSPSLASELSEVAVNGGVASPGAGESEVLLDIDTVLAATSYHPMSYVVYDAPPSTSFVQIFQTMIADGDTVISNSWSQCEDQTSMADAQAIDSVLANAAASGITVVNGTGDNGSTCLDGSPDTIGVPADSPNATAVGGTSPTFGPGLSYGSESWWNDQTATPPGGAGGFGVSRYFAAPADQQSLSGSTMRSVPDLSFDADPGAGIELCQADAGGCPDNLLWGGTSMATPSVAALVADLNSDLGHNVGNLNTALYPLAGTSAFHSPQSMGSDFTHVGLGSPDFTAILGLLSSTSTGVVSGSTSQAVAMGEPQADGVQQGLVRIDLEDANGFPVSGKAVMLSANSGCNATISAASGPSGSTDGSVTFTVTDAVAETCTFTVTDTTDDGITLSTQPTLTFVAPTATGAQIYGGPAQVHNDGTSEATITVYLENSLDQPASGKTVTLSEGVGQCRDHTGRIVDSGDDGRDQQRGKRRLHGDRHHRRGGRLHRHRHNRRELARSRQRVGELRPDHGNVPDHAADPGHRDLGFGVCDRRFLQHRGCDLPGQLHRRYLHHRFRSGLRQLG